MVAVLALAALALLACRDPEPSASGEPQPVPQTPAATPAAEGKGELQAPAGWREELLDLDPADVCDTLGEGEFEPYEQFSITRNDAEAIMADGWSFRQKPSFRLEPPIDWEHLVTVDRSWNYHLNAWEPIDPVLAELERTSEPRYLSFVLGMAVDWIAENPYQAPETDVEDFGWYDMAVGLRAYRLAYLLEAACRSSEVPPDQVSQLWESLLDHFDYLADDENIVFHNNHGLYQASGQLAAATRLSGFPAISEFREQAADRFERMFSQQFSSEGVHLEHSPGYHRLVTGLVSGIASSGLLAEFPALSSRIERFEEVLAWMVLPSGRMANLGDTDYLPLRQADFKLIRSPLLDYVLSGGESGQPASQRVGVFPESGLAVLRSGWPGPESFEQASYLAQQAAFHSRTHKHADDLSFVWYDRGTEILIDAGRYGFQGRTETGSDLRNRGFWYSDPKRIYVESTHSHNTVEIDGMSYDRRKSPPYGSAIEGWGETSDGLMFVETLAPQFETMHHSRLLVLNPGSWLLVYDRVWDEASEEHDYRQWFQFAPDLTVESKTGGLHVTGESLDRALTVVSLIPGPVPSVPVAGQEEPELLGWWSERGGVFEPTTSVNFSLRQSDAAVFATLFSFSDGVAPDLDYQSAGAPDGSGRFRWEADGGTHTLALSRLAEGDLTLEYSAASGR